MSPRMTKSHLSSLKINPRINEDISQVADQVEYQADEGKDIKRAEHDRVIAADGGLDTDA